MSFRTLLTPIRWWWSKFTRAPGKAITILVVLVIAVAVLGALGLRIALPESATVVAPFECPPSFSGPIAVTGNTIADMVADKMQSLVEEASDYAGQPVAREASISSSLFATAPLPGSARVDVRVGGFTLDALFALLRSVREKQHVVHGNIFIVPEGVVLRARMDAGRSWVTGPSPATKQGLESACERLALGVLAGSEPVAAGLLYEKRGENDLAVAVFRDWLSRGPGSVSETAEAHFYLGTALDRKGDYDGAIMSYREAIKLKCDFSAALTNLGSDLYQKRMLQEAIKSYSEALNYNARDPATWLNYGNALLDSGQLGAAITAYLKARELAPQLPQIRYNLALALLRAGRKGDADRELAEAKRLFNSAPATQ